MIVLPKGGGFWVDPPSDQQPANDQSFQTVASNNDLKVSIGNSLHFDIGQ